MSLLLTVVLAAVALALLFAAAYRFARRIDNYAIVDVVWSYAFGALVLFYASVLPGWAPRRWTIAALVLVWSLRLGAHLHRRVQAHHPAEDTRYQALRTRWSADFARQMFVFFQQQAASVLLLGVPFLLAARNPAAAFHPLEYAGAALWFLALAGEALADAQLAAFQRDPANRGQVCAVGLWSVSRHPNYFFESLIWWAYFLFALASPWGWTALIAPLGITYLLLRVTGVPLAEAQSLRSRGDAYRAYQKRVSAFVPWFPKK